MNKLITILIPAYNESAVLGQLYKRLSELADSQSDYRFEFLFVNDGSRDDTLDIIKHYAELDQRVSYVNLA
ncbi:glycosyltransferase, partial [Candidatus Saccharibacteria bacterium 32-49-10]